MGSERTLKVRPFVSVYPGGSAGMGLLIVRAALGLCVIWRSAALLVRDVAHSAWVPATLFLAIVCGLSILAGYRTRVCGLFLAFAAPACLLIASISPDTTVASLLASSICVTLFTVGPGAYSLDSVLFGRKEILL